MKRNDVFLKTKEFGDLYFKDCLLNFEYPRAFICKKLDSNELFMFYEMESNGSSDIWLMVGISNDEYWNIANRVVSLQDIYRNKPVNDLCTVINLYLPDDDETMITRDGVKWLQYLPKEPVFAE